MQPDMTVDVIVPTLDEERYVKRCLEAVLGQDYPPDLLSVICVDSGSSDGTVEIARSVAATDPRLTVIAGRGRLNLPQAVNVALACCSGNLVTKIDAHGYPDDDYVRRAVAAFERLSPEVAAVGGRAVQEGDTAWGQAVARSRTSRFGTGGSVYARTDRSGPADTVQCGVYRRSILLEVGAFKETMVFCEDEELNWRLRENGYIVYLDPSIRFHYVTRPTIGALYRQYRNYGRAKVTVGAAHPRFIRPWHLAPAVAVTAGTLLGVGALSSTRARQALTVALTAYAASAAAAASASGGPKDPTSLARVAACFPAIHIGYGTGMIQGLIARAHPRRGSHAASANASVPFSYPRERCRTAV